MSLTLYLHPLASFCHKVLIALYENGTPFTPQIVDLMDEGSAANHLARWPVGKIPVLHDAKHGQLVPETSIIIEYLEMHYSGTQLLLPQDPEVLLQARLWDRFFDLYVSVPMQKIVIDRIRPAESRDPYGVDEARQTLRTAYRMIDGQRARGPWAVGEAFSIADCSAAPALFFASIVEPIPAELTNLNSYLGRLVERPSVRRVYREAAPYFSMFPYRDAMPERYLNL
jgi:glutathione S-transferase